MAKILAVVFLVLTLCIFGTAQANLVTNGGFETGDFTGWTQGGNTGFTNVSTQFGGVDPEEGNYQAYFGAVGSDATLAQTLSTTASQSYDLSFWLYSFDGTPNDYSVSWNGNILDSLINSGSFGYTQKHFVATASGANTVLQFNFRQDPNYWLLDNVSVTPISTPEPISLLFLGTGLIGLFGLRRNFRN
jgi:hypothetical protein